MRGEGREGADGKGRGGEERGGKGGEGSGGEESRGEEGRRREGEEAFLAMWPRRFSALNPPLPTSRDLVSLMSN